MPIKVVYKLQDSAKIQQITISRTQYDNLHNLPLSDEIKTNVKISAKLTRFTILDAAQRISEHESVYRERNSNQARETGRPRCFTTKKQGAALGSSAGYEQRTLRQNGTYTMAYGTKRRFCSTSTKHTRIGLRLKKTKHDTWLPRLHLTAV